MLQVAVRFDAYRVYIENQENGQIIFANETAWKFEEGSVEPYSGRLVDNLAQVENSNTSRAAILAIWHLNQSYYYIPGYAYDTEIGANNQTVYLELKRDTGETFTYESVSTDSTGIDYYPDKSYTRNSFIARIPEELMPDGNYSIRTIIQDNTTQKAVYAPGELYCTIKNHEAQYD